MKRSDKKKYSREFMSEFVKEIKKESVREFKEGVPEKIAYQLVEYINVNYTNPMWHHGINKYAKYVLTGLTDACFKEKNDEKER